MDDRYGNGVTTASQAAIRYYDRAVDAVRLGGSHAQRCVVVQTRDALRLPS